ncbi:MAG: hypothetical protein EXR45_03360 [Chloroflexi bacterium]|nr:hypothetical protein [Chloroflexota bacterium]
MDTDLRPSRPWQARIRAVNAANGWAAPTGTGEWREIVTRLALANTEVAEAIEVVRRRPLDRPHLAEELADVVIRLFDLGEGLGIEVLGQDAHDVTPSGSEMVAIGLTDQTDTTGLVVALGIIGARIARPIPAFTAPERAPAMSALAHDIGVACTLAIELAGCLGLNLRDAIDSKITLNASRGFHHGGKAI